MACFLGFLGSAGHAAYDTARYARQNSYVGDPEIQANIESKLRNILGVSTAPRKSPEQLETERQASVNFYVAETNRRQASEKEIAICVKKSVAAKVRADDIARNPALVAEAALTRINCLALKVLIDALQEEIRISGQNSELLARVYIKDKSGKVHYGFKHDGSPAIVSDERLYNRFEEFYNRIYGKKPDFFYKIGYGFVPCVTGTINDQSYVCDRLSYYKSKKNAYIGMLGEYLAELKRIDPNNRLLANAQTGRYVWYERSLTTMKNMLIENGLPEEWKDMLLVKFSDNATFPQLLRKFPIK